MQASIDMDKSVEAVAPDRSTQSVATQPAPSVRASKAQRSFQPYSMTRQLWKALVLCVIGVWVAMAVMVWATNRHEFQEVMHLLQGRGDWAHQVLLDFQEMYRTSMMILLAGCVMSAILLSAALYFLIPRALSPLHDLSQALADQSDHNTAPLAQPDPMPQEIQSIFEAINGFIQRIQESIEREKHFITHASHELRSPISAILAHAQVLKQQTGQAVQLQAAQGERSQQQLIVSAERLARLVDQLLTLAQVQQLQSAPALFGGADPALDAASGKALQTAQALPLTRINLSELMRTTIAQDLDQQVAAPTLQLSLERPSARGDASDDTQDWWVLSNARLLSLLLGNLISNAFKYTPAHGVIRCQCTGVEGRSPNNTLVLSIDNDCQLEPSTPWDQLGQRFFRGQHLHTRATADIAGSGLGLAICQQIAQLLNIDLKFDIAKDYTRFRVELTLQSDMT